MIKINGELYYTSVELSRAIKWALDHGMTIEEITNNENNNEENETITITDIFFQDSIMRSKNNKVPNKEGALLITNDGNKYIYLNGLWRNIKYKEEMEKIKNYDK